MRPSLFPIALVAIAGAASAQTPTSLFQIETATIQSGYWSYSNQAAASDVAFLDARGQAQLTVRCTRATRQISLNVPSPAGTGTVTIWTTGGIRNLAGRFDQQLGQVIAEVPAGDAILDVIAFSRGRFAVQLAGFAPLVVPAAPEVARAVEDCRS